ncbi:MAG TPA: serine hydrolase domain-containing protein [Blastocatellia bacterium]|nr:serine hydrolase domain-containing protein [Blastocatellia bacterium]
MPKASEIVSSYLQSEIVRGSFPGAQYLIGERQQVIAEDALGWAVIEPELIPATVDTIYDLASLTKPLITSLLVVLCAQRGALDLTAPLAAYLEEFDNQERKITLTELLTHTSGLPNWRPLYVEAKSREEVPATIARVSLEQRAHDSKEVVYSDLNYILLGFVLERLTGERLDHLAERDIFNPLGLGRTMFNPPAKLIREIAATERGQVFELANALADVRMRGGDRATLELSSPGNLSGNAFPSSLTSSLLPFSAERDPWRTDVIWGEVHDGNAHFMGGVAGHAGLFSTARDVFRIANQFLDGSQLLEPGWLHLFRDNLTRGSDTSRSIAWIRAQTRDCSAGPALSPAAIGHNGFTGGSVWMEPNERRIFILLTNRVHPHVDAIDMREIRRRFNTLAVETVAGF